MPVMYEIRWFPSGRTQRFPGSRGNYYECSESDRLELRSVPVWCRRCGECTTGEDLSSVEQIDAQLRDLYDPTSQLYRMTQPFLQERLTELQWRRRWRETRLSPPRCIRCGSADILPLPIGERVPNPAGEGELQIDCVGMCSTSFNEWFFTPEGDRIPRDTRPTYWHHPELDGTEGRDGLLQAIRSRAVRRVPPAS